MRDELPPVTIETVATKAGVSTTTVSHALSGKGRVKTSTRKRIATIAKELGYVGNRQARALKTGRSLVILAELPGKAKSSPTLQSHFVSDILLGAARCALELGYVLTVAGRGMHLESSALEFDGALVVDPTPDQASITDRNGVSCPTVSIGTAPTGQEMISHVDNDYADGTLEILDHLLARGYRRPALIITRSRASYAITSATVFKAWCAAHKLDAVIEHVRGYPGIDNGLAAATSLLSESPRPDAILTGNEEMAIGVLRAANQLSLGMPDELGLASIQDSGRLDTASTPVTALNLQPIELGSRAIGLLIEMIEGSADPDLVETGITVPTKLNIRSSTLREA